MADAGAPPVGGKTFFGHPRGLATLFLTEFWERFSFYGMRALLALYLAAGLQDDRGPGLGFDVGSANAIFGAYVGLAYLTPMMGGWVADRVVGARRAVLYGGIIIAAGHYSMAVPADAAFWIGLLLVALGTGLLKPSVSALVGGLYGVDEDARRDAGFSIFYMGINLGAFLAPLVTGALSQEWGWHAGFGVAALGMTFGVIQFVAGRKYLGSIGDTAPMPADSQVIRRVALLGLGGLAGFVAVAWLWIAIRDYSTAEEQINVVVNLFSVVMLAIPVFYFAKLFRAPSLTTVEKSRVRAFLVIFCGAAVFWMIFEQTGGVLNLFAEQYVNLPTIGSWTMPASFLQSVNPMFIIIFAPIFGWIWVKLGDRAPSTIAKFAISLFGMALSYFILVVPGAMVDNGEKVSVYWLITVYLIFTWGELLLSPTGLSVTTRLAPASMESQLLALWFLAAGVGATVGGQAAKVMSGLPVAAYFGVLGGFTLVAAVVVSFLVPYVKRQMAGVH